MKRLQTVTLMAAAALLCACSTQNDLTAMARGGYLFQPSTAKMTPNQSVSHGYWDMPAGLTGSHAIVIDTQTQQARYYVGNTQVGISTISSGKAGHGTPKGTFPILSKDIDHKSSKYGKVVDAMGNTLIGDYTVGGSTPMPAGGKYEGAAMNFGMQLTHNGIWMHEGIVTAAPESHGCIRLPREMARIFFEHAEVGTPVIIR